MLKPGDYPPSPRQLDSTVLPLRDDAGSNPAWVLQCYAICSHSIETMPQKKPGDPGLYANIHAKQERIKQGSGETMRKPDEKGAPTDKAFRDSAKTAKKK